MPYIVGLLICQKPVDYKDTISANTEFPSYRGKMLKIMDQIVVQSYTCKQSFTNFDNTNLLVSSCKKKWKHLIVETCTLLLKYIIVLQNIITLLWLVRKTKSKILKT